MILEMRRKCQKSSEKLYGFEIFENTWAGWNRAISLSFVSVKAWEWILQSGRTFPEDVPFGWKLRVRLWWFQIVGSSGDTEITDMVMLTAYLQHRGGGNKKRWSLDSGSTKKIHASFWIRLGYIKLIFYFLEWAFFSWLYSNYEKVLLCLLSDFVIKGKTHKSVLGLGGGLNPYGLGVLQYENSMHLSNTGRFLLKVGETAALEMTYCNGSHRSPQSPWNPIFLWPQWRSTARKHCPFSFCNLVSHDLTRSSGFPIDKCSALQGVF